MADFRNFMKDLKKLDVRLGKILMTNFGTTSAYRSKISSSLFSTTSNSNNSNQSNSINSNQSNFLIFENLKEKCATFSNEMKRSSLENEELKNAIEQCENKREEMNKNIITFIDENKQLKNENREQKEMIENYQIENNSIKKKISRLKQKLFSDIVYEPFKASNSQLIDELKEAIVNHKTSIDDFNKLSLKSQYEIISIIQKVLVQR